MFCYLGNSFSLELSWEWAIICSLERCFMPDFALFTYSPQYTSCWLLRYRFNCTCLNQDLLSISCWQTKQLYIQSTNILSWCQGGQSCSPIMCLPDQELSLIQHIHYGSALYFYRWPKNLLYFIALTKYNWHTINCTYLGCTIWGVLTYVCILVKSTIKQQASLSYQTVSLLGQESLPPTCLTGLHLTSPGNHGSFCLHQLFCIFQNFI